MPKVHSAYAELTSTVRRLRAFGIGARYAAAVVGVAAVGRDRLVPPGGLRGNNKPAKNIRSGLPRSAWESAIGRTLPKRLRTYGPTITPRSSNPIVAGIWRERRGDNDKHHHRPAANFASTGIVNR